MKQIFPILSLLLLLSINLNAQQQYTINGQSYTLKTGVDGSLTLLWNSIDGQYRYFLKKEDAIVELTNTKRNGHYQEEFKAILKQQTADAPVATENVNLTLPSLQIFFASYNKKKDPGFSDSEKAIGLQFRLGGFAGISNSVFSDNFTNAMQPVAGIDLELLENVKLKRHALVLRFKKTFEGSGYKYSASQFSLNYRFKFVKTSRFDVFVNCKFAALTFSKKEVRYATAEEPVPPVYVTDEISGSDFNAPLTFGIGADYKLGNGYITFNYHDIVGLNMESNGEFPIDFSVGYKFNL